MRFLPFILLTYMFIMQSLYGGGARFFPQFILSPRTAIDFLCSSSPSHVDFLVDIRVLTLHNQRRVSRIRTEFNNHNLGEATFITAQYKDASYLGEFKSYRALLNATFPGKYLLVLEDDAVLFMDFKRQLACLLEEEFDVYWLAARNWIDFQLRGYPKYGTVGMLFRTSILPEILDAFQEDSPLLQDEPGRFPVDVLLSRLPACVCS